MIVCLVTTYNRPQALARSLPQIVALGAPVLVVDDGSTNRRKNEDICLGCQAQYLYLPMNRGLAAAMNAGLAYWLADKSIEWISYFQDDVDVHPRCLQILSQFQKSHLIMTGHDATAHPSHHGTTKTGNVPVKYKWSSAGVHIYAAAGFWADVWPIPTFELGAPKRNGNSGRGIGSNVDWWIVKDSPYSSKKLGKEIVCVPNLVRTFCWRPEDSSWNNFLPTGEEPPLMAL